MDDEFRDQLRRLGVVKGTRSLKPAPPVKRPEPSSAERYGWMRPGDQTGQIGQPYEPQPLDQLLPGGRVEETSVGGCFVLDKVYPVSYRHGPDQLSGLLDWSAEPAAIFCKDQRLKGLSFRDFLFIDTETTGLAGAGTLAFMVGVAFFESGPTGDVLVVRQYFLRDHGDEPGMLTLLDELMAGRQGLISFNGRSFDLPLLDTRFLMNRMPTDIRERPHIDLLHPSRRLWRDRLGSVALGALEVNLLGLHRTHQDVPGWMIPAMYTNYLRSGDASELVRVFYHNQIDMLSMVTLTSRLLDQFVKAGEGNDPLDLLSLGKWQADLGLESEAERNLRLAAAGDLPLDLYHQALHRLGLLLRRADRRAEAVPVWQQIAATSFSGVEAHVELAKHYEWHQKELSQAITWIERAMALVNSWDHPRRAELERDELLYRLARLKRKQRLESADAYSPDDAE